MRNYPSSLKTNMIKLTNRSDKLCVRRGQDEASARLLGRGNNKQVNR